MSGLPVGWTETTGEELFAIVRGVTYEKADIRATPAIGFSGILRATNISDGQLTTNDLVYAPNKYVSDLQCLKAGDIVIATSSGSKSVVGKAAQATDEHAGFAFGAFCTVARPKTEMIGKWLSAYTQTRSYREYVERFALGININNLRGTDLKFMPLALPPEAEQRRIVTKIDSLTAKSARAREHLDHLPRLVEKYKQAILAAAFRGDLTREWRTSQSPSHNARSYVAVRQSSQADRDNTKYLGRDERAAQLLLDSELERNLLTASKQNSLPDTWCWSAIGLLFGVYVGATPSRKMSDYWSGTVPWVSSGEVAFCRIDKTKEYITVDGLANTSTRQHPIGTVLIGMIGEGKTRGQVAILDIAAANNQNCAAIRVSEANYTPEYLYYYLWMTYSMTRSFGGGNNQPALNKDRVQRMLFPLAPPNEAEQVVSRIQTAFTWIDQLAAEATSARKLVDKLDQAILAKAFRGELVPQDPNDEPASVLLERIRSERAGSALKKARGRPRKGG